jgi:septum formation protein
MATLGIPFSSMKPDIDEKAVRHPDPYGLPVVVAAAKCDALLERVHIPAIVITADQIVVAPSESAAADAEASTAECMHDSVVAAIRLPVGESILNFPGMPAPTTTSGDADTKALPRAQAPPPEGNGRVPAGVGLVVREKPRDAEEAKRFMAAYSDSWVQCVSGLVVHNTATGARAAGVDVATVRYTAIPASAIEEATSAGADADVLHCCGAVMVEHPSISPYVASMGAPLQSVMGLPVELLRELMHQVGWEEPSAAPAV